MKELDVKPGYACNNSCVFCFNRDKRLYKEFPRDAIIGQIEASARMGCRKLVISGGEPLISPYLFSILRAASDSGIAVIEIQTNGRMLWYKDFLEKIIRVQPMRYTFLVSLHFPERKLYRTYCRTDGFEQVRAGLRHLVKQELSFTVNTVVMKQNLGLLGEITSLVRSLGVRRQQFRMIDGRNLGDRFYEYVPALSAAIPELRKVIRKNRDAMDFAIREFPLCMLKGELGQYRVSWANPERETLAIGNRVFRADEIEREQFVFGPACTACSRKADCRGVRNLYGERYGFPELKPFKARCLSRRTRADKA